jgi:hypothetical protein
MSSFLTDEKYQEALLSVFNEYHNDLEEILELATIEKNGYRPLHIENEIYALFHHISRSLCSIPAIEEAIKEVERAKSSHLKRAILDSYKITINSVLTESDRKTELLEELATDHDYREVINESIVNLDILKDTKSKIKKTYLEAKKTERDGRTSEAIKLYNSTLELINELSNSIKSIEQNNTFRLALKRIKRIEKDKRKQKRYSLYHIILAALLTALFSIAVNIVLDTIRGPGVTQNSLSPATEAVKEE